MNIEAVIRRAREVRSRQQVWHPHWDDLARVMVPRLLGFSETVVEGVSRTEEIYDGTPMRASRGLANAIGGLLRPEGEKWFFVRADQDADDAGMRWLEDSESRLRAAFDNPKARMRQTLGETDLGLVVFGTAPFFLGEAAAMDHLLFRSVPLRDAAIDWGEENDLLALYRFRRLTVRQAEKRFGEENLGSRARELLRAKKLDERLTYIHAVAPREDRIVGGILARNLPIASLWIEEESKHVVEESGFHEFPYIVPRMETAPDEDYGRSPGMIALPDANTLQAMGETILVAGQRAADPPIFAPNDGAFQTPNTFPGGISYYDAALAAKIGRNPIFAMDTGTNLPISRDMQLDVREQVFAAFFRNVLNLPVDGPEMTATEVIQRREEFIREIGPMFGRLESDYTAPVVERGFMLMLRAGQFGPIPPSLAGRNIRFEYESPVKRIRQQIEAAAARMLKDEVLTIAAIKPEAMDVFDEEAYLRFVGEASKVPSVLLRSPEAVAARRAARAEAEQAAAAMAATEQAAKIAKDGAGAVKQMAEMGAG